MEDIKRKFNRDNYFILLVIITIGIVIRVILQPDYLNLDECGNFLIARCSLPDQFFINRKRIPHPPLTHILMKPFININSSVYMVRAVSFLSGIVNIILVNIFLYNILKSYWIATVGTFFFSIISSFVKLSYEAREYSLCLTFIWLSFLLTIQLWENKSQKFLYYWLFGFINLLIIITEYSGIFHVISLIIVNFFFLLFRKRRWKRFILFFIPQIISIGIALGLFNWQFNGKIPTQDHVKRFMYQGDLSDIKNIIIFARNGFIRLMNGVAPNPFGISLLFSLPFPFLPVFKKNLLQRISKYFALYAILYVTAVFIASLFRLYPLGGYHRHATLMYPGVLLTSFLVITMFLNIFFNNPYRIIVSILLGALSLFFILKGISINCPRSSYTKSKASSLVLEYIQNPGPIITNNRGHDVSSWWLLSSRKPRLIIKDKSGYRIFDYEGIIVFVYDKDKDIINKAASVTKNYGCAWIVMCFADKGDKASSLVDNFPYVEIKNYDDIKLSKKIKFLYGTAIVKLERISKR